MSDEQAGSADGIADRTALVVGGSGGMGSAVVRRLACSHGRVVSTYFRDRRSAECAADATNGAADISTIKVDLRKPESLRTAVDACGGRIDTVVFAAASGVWEPLADIRDRHWDWTFDINLRALLSLYQMTLPGLQRASGTLVVLTSNGGESVIPGYGLIGLTKAATQSFIRYAAVEAGPRGIRVNGVSAGLVKTKALNHLPGLEDLLDRVAGETPLGRLVTPDDVADAVAWLTSPRAVTMTGQTLMLDGGHELVSSSFR